MANPGDLDGGRVVFEERPVSHFDQMDDDTQDSSSLSSGEHHNAGNFGALQSHRGKGPKGFVRSDDNLKHEISHQLEDSHEVDASDIEVSVSGGQVTLSGTVADRNMKYHAEELVDRIAGVKDLENQIKVKRS